ncbi:MAG: SDR family oxidoreductase [Trueperaceae bacterium]|nr:SDR family oxidoreductase [Trueperaceae bacterium]
MRLEDKVILITGSSTGIGEATAERCLAEGARVMIHGLDEAETAETAGRLSQPYMVADLALTESANTVIAKTIEYYGRIDGLVNNAASTARSDLSSTHPDFFDQMIAINLRTPLFMIQAAVPHMKAQGKGAVVNIGSVNAYCGHPNLLDYSISKGGLMTLTRNLANALAPDHIRVNQLNPGWTLSRNEIALQISEGQPEDWYNQVSPRLAPTGRLLEPSEIAAHVVHWLSDASAPASGVIYEVEQFPVIGRPGGGL